MPTSNSMFIQQIALNILFVKVVVVPRWEYVHLGCYGMALIKGVTYRFSWLVLQVMMNKA